MIFGQLVLPGNAMTASVISACMFSIMCYALPTSSGRPLLSGPSPIALNLVPSATPECLPFGFDDAKTLIPGDDDAESVVVSVVVDGDAEDAASSGGFEMVGSSSSAGGPVQTRD